MTITDAILVRSLMLFLLAGSVVGVFAGISMLLRPEWLKKSGMIANRWISTRQAARPLVRSFNIDSFIYRYNQPFGVLLMIGSVFVIYYFSNVFNAKSAMNGVFGKAGISPVLMMGMIDGFVLIAIVGAVFAMLASLFLMFRPGMLRDFEKRANQQVSMRRSLKPMEVLHEGLDHYVFKHRQLIGLSLLLGSLYTFVILYIWIKK